MGCTLVAAVDDGSSVQPTSETAVFTFIHENEIRQVTKDHSYVEEMVAQRENGPGKTADYNRRKYHYPCLGNRKDSRGRFFLRRSWNRGIIFFSVRRPYQYGGR